MGERIEVVETNPQLTAGRAGIRGHAPGCCTTVSALAHASGGTGSGHLVSTDIK